MSLRRLDEFAFVYEKVASYANFRASFSSVLIMAEESSHSQDLNNAFIIERTPFCSFRKNVAGYIGMRVVV